MPRRGNPTRSIGAILLGRARDYLLAHAGRVASHWGINSPNLRRLGWTLKEMEVDKRMLNGNDSRDADHYAQSECEKHFHGAGRRALFTQAKRRA